MFYHLSAMLAAYISAVTAFIVINAHSVPMLYRWLVPGVIGTLVITAFSSKYGCASSSQIALQPLGAAPRPAPGRAARNSGRATRARHGERSDARRDEKRARFREHRVAKPAGVSDP